MIVLLFNLSLWGLIEKVVGKLCITPKIKVRDRRDEKERKEKRKIRPEKKSRLMVIPLISDFIFF